MNEHRCKGPCFSCGRRFAPVRRGPIAIANERALIRDHDAEASGSALLPLAMQHGAIEIPRGVVCVDTVGLSTLLSEADLATISEVAAKVGASLDRVEKKLLKTHNDDLAAMLADYEATREDLAKEVEDAAALEAQAAEDPTTGDKLAGLKAKVRYVLAYLPTFTSAQCPMPNA